MTHFRILAGVQLEVILGAQIGKKSIKNLHGTKTWILGLHKMKNIDFWNP